MGESFRFFNNLSRRFCCSAQIYEDMLSSSLSDAFNVCVVHISFYNRSCR